MSLPSHRPRRPVPGGRALAAAALTGVAVAGAGRRAGAQSAAAPAAAAHVSGGVGDVPADVLADDGAGPVTYVLVSGLAGGTGQYRRLRAHLLRAGHRVVTVDPYRFSLDSADVTFDALARRLDALLARRAVRQARVVGHAHGAGVALRLAARAPERVSALYFLDVGALAQNRTKVFSASLRLAPLVVRMPGGRGFVRGRFVRGLRQNAGRSDWLDGPTQREYTEPFLAQLPAVVAMAGRLANAREPEPVAAVVARVRAPVTVLLGAAAHPAAPDADELEALAPLGDRLRVERLSGVGHFPHQEVPADVAARIAGAGGPG